MQTRSLLIQGGRILDPAHGIDEPLDLVLRGGIIQSLQPVGRTRIRSGRVLDARGLWVLPGLIDLHTHLREPGREEAEDIDSGTLAAVAGGFTSVVCMPNTQPPLDRASRVASLARTIRRKAHARVFIAAALSTDLAGQIATDPAALVRAGAAALSDDGVGTRRADLLANALSGGARHGLPVLVHCEDHRLSRTGAMRAGSLARRLGLSGIPASAEHLCVGRHLRVLKSEGGHLHLQHLSTHESVQWVRRAKRIGLPVSAEVTPHHLFLTSQDVAASCRGGRIDTCFKMNPPLGTARDREALRCALSDGTIDAVATDHAPHTAAEKARPFSAAPFGVVGLETCLALVLQLVDEGNLDLTRAIDALTVAPARILGLRAGSIWPGWPADLTLVDPGERWRVRPEAFRSKSRNTPFAGWSLRGRVRCTLIGGEIAYSRRGD